jgi:hypothetical protein
VHAPIQLVHKALGAHKAGVRSVAVVAHLVHLQVQFPDL